MLHQVIFACRELTKEELGKLLEFLIGEVTNDFTFSSGDSGGPLTVIRNGQKILVGITSYGAVAGCEKGYPPVFTRVGSYISWLQKNTI